MNRIVQAVLLVFIVISGCNTEQSIKDEITGEQSRVIKEMIDAVNEKDAEKYVKGFANEVQVFVESQIKVNGKESLKKNRAQHFKNHPNVRSEIQYLIEIDNRVILHDKVWLNPSYKVGHDIVEIFTFKDGKVIRIDVIQPKDLFRN